MLVANEEVALDQANPTTGSILVDFSEHLIARER